MAVSSGVYFLSFEKALIDTLGESWEAEDNYAGLVTDTHTPNFDTHDFTADITNEITGGNYARDTVTTTEITVSSGTATFDVADIVYDNGGNNDVTISNAEAAFFATNVGSDATDQLQCMSDFGAPISCTNSTFTIAVHANGLVTFDLVP